MEDTNKKIIMIPKWLLYAFVAAGIVGFFDATYLAVKHFLGTPVTCSVFEGCERVTSSPYATLGPVPVALLGALYYLIIVILMLVYFSNEISKEKTLKLAARLTILGFTASLWFVYLQLFVIKAICFYCMLSALTSAVLFILGIYEIILEYKFKKVIT